MPERMMQESSTFVVGMGSNVALLFFLSSWLPVLILVTIKSFKNSFWIMWYIVLKRACRN